MDCLIVGGGVIGLSLAWQLARRGKKVRVLDRQELGREASWAGAGILPPANREALAHPYDQLRGMSFELHREWAEQLRAETGIETGYRRCGGIYLARAAGETAALAAWAETLREERVEVERLSVSGRELGRPGAEGQSIPSPITPPPHRLLSELETGISLAPPGGMPIRAAWLLPDECQLRNPHYLQALVRVCEQAGVELSPNVEVQDFVLAGDRVRGVVTAAGEISADQVCVTSGAWTGLLLQRLGLTLGVVPVRGQIVLFRGERPAAKCVINEGPRYLVPREDGRLLVGSTEEEAGFEKRTTEVVIAELIAFARSLLPVLNSAEIEKTWAGLRPASFDGFPYLGPIPGMSNAFVASGHFRSGLYLSPGTATVMAELMCGAETSIDLSVFRVGR
ncbi:NAD(P)/FAD-dependent oxidoreductase [Anatilimnocola floriformis]|uniref:NAD(P)/FAD-dependent oxidoreductase n=1 Tax=Anatilimnocola floriformis TaxID=2948575 RepID=UPI0020C43971|nr:FAD-dependent oxidoreductase [Anatilimnocola floriformis]